MRTLTLCTALLCFNFTAFAAKWNGGADVPQSVLDQYEACEFNGMPYRFLLPEDYDPAQEYPLILSLHGGAGKGDDNASQMRHWTKNFTNAAWRAKYPCVVIAPQSIAPQSELTWSITGDAIPEFTDAELAKFPEAWQARLREANLPTEPVKDGSLTKAFALIDKICEDHNIDKKRIYVIGHSGGGFGTWNALWAAPERFAAAIPSAGGMMPWKDPAKFKDVPIWTFHGDADKVVSVENTRAIYARMVEVGGNMKYSELKKVGHGASKWAFALEDQKSAKGYTTQYASEQCDKTPLVWKWLFAQSLSTPKQIPQPVLEGAPVAGLAAEVNRPDATDLSEHGIAQEQLDSLAAILHQAVEQEQIAGCSFLVAHKGEVVFREAFGYADIEAKRPFTTEELLPVASVSKPFMASVMMALVDQGKLKLDDPVEKYLPEFKGKKVKGSQSPARPITIRHLLSHSGGIWGNKKASPEMIKATRNFERHLSEAVNGIAKFDLAYEPGTKFQYSDSGLQVAGRVAEVALGDQSFEKIAQDVLFRPLGLNRTTYLPSKEARKAMPAQYLSVKGKLQKQPTMGENVDLRLILPGASLSTTMDEIAVLGQMHLNDGLYNGRRILSAASVTEMRRLQSPGPKPEKTYGLCWYRGDISEAGPADLVFHGGRRGGLLRIDRRRETVTVFLVHSEFKQVQQIHENLNQHVEQMFPVANDR